MMASLVTCCNKQLMVNSEAKGEHLGFKQIIVWLEHACVIEPNRVQSEAEVEEANGDAIEQSKGDDYPGVDRLRLKEVQPLCDIQCEEGDHQVSVRQRRRCIIFVIQKKFRNFRCKHGNNNRNKSGDCNSERLRTYAH
jgi:hypothetical protein